MVKKIVIAWAAITKAVNVVSPEIWIVAQVKKKFLTLKLMQKKNNRSEDKEGNG